MMQPFFTFIHPELGHVRVLAFDGQWWMLAKDVTAMLGYDNVAKAVRSCVRMEDLAEIVLPTANGSYQKTLMLNPYGFKTLVRASRRPDAEAILNWMVEELMIPMGLICENALSEYNAIPKETNKQMQPKMPQTPLEKEIQVLKQQINDRNARIAKLENENKQFTQFFRDIFAVHQD